jgi:hypothetical protein
MAVKKIALRYILYRKALGRDSLKKSAWLFPAYQDNMDSEIAIVTKLSLFGGKFPTAHVEATKKPPPVSST